MVKLFVSQSKKITRIYYSYKGDYLGGFYSSKVSKLMIVKTSVWIVLVDMRISLFYVNV